MNVPADNQLPTETLERRAAEQRDRIHNSVGELKSSISELKSNVEEKVRERLDPKKFARRHLWELAGGVSAFAVLAGFGVAGLFTRR